MQEQDETQLGQERRGFAIVDDMGFWIQVCAIGRCARSPAIENGNDVVMYFGAARPGFRSGPGTVCLFNDSMLVWVGTKIVQEHVQLELSSK